ncbi:hypothetical protein ACFOLD_00075 [Kocuria carniphila]|uniref:hypothetical protein n=1 Tax=Kocuria carniphila TaxID=262208 RepID=UPI00360F52AF
MVAVPRTLRNRSRSDEVSENTSREVSNEFLASSDAARAVSTDVTKPLSFCAARCRVSALEW